MTPKEREVVITAMGIVSPLGSNLIEFKKRMFAGESGICNIRGNVVGNSFPIPYAGWIDQDKLPKPTWVEGTLKDSPLFAALATEQLLSELPNEAKIDAIVFGTAENIGFDLVQESFKHSIDDETLKVYTAEHILHVVSDTLKNSGKQSVDEANLISINSACASGNQAIGMAMQRIRAGNWKRAIVGAVDTRCNGSNLMNFNMLGALSTVDVPANEASRPFSGDRCGFVRGVGAATFIIESRKSAEERGANILGVISGYGFTSDSYRLTDGREDALAVIKAMNLAIEDGHLSKSDIGAISAHGTSTPLNDRIETKAIKEVFGESAKQIPVTSLKSQIGHSTVAAGGIETIACLMMLEEQMLAPTINYKVPDPDCDLDYVPNHARKATVNHILSNNFGFGGQNACIVISKAN
ncbi:MAG: beta-ketoacyl-[acyl-carrier-protein] synthase family protein [Bdellovibrionota bacterium]